MCVAVAFGVGSLVERSVLVYNVIKWAGAVYLVYLGVQAIRHRRAISEALATQTAPVTALRAVRDGLIVGTMNPKSIVFLVAALPQFVYQGHDHLPVPAQMLIVGSMFPVIALTLDSAWAATAGTARNWLMTSPRRAAMIGGAGGLAMIGLGLSIAATGRKD